MKKNLCIASIVILSMALIFVGIFMLIRSYYMSRINGIDFPDDVEVVDTTVQISDVYGMHIAAEAIIETKLSYDEVKRIVDDSKYGYSISVHQIYYDEYGDAEMDEWVDDSVIDVGQLSGKEKEGMNYFLIQSRTSYGPFPMWLFWEKNEMPAQ